MRDCFEIREEDLLGRVGRLKTKKGVVETPTLAPVVDPSYNVVPPQEIAKLGFDLLMTNAYLIKRRYGPVALEIGVHGILGVDVPVMTDSGAYQLMEYGEVDAKPLEIVEYQIRLSSDIGVILDIPTRYGVSKETVAEEVRETLRRAREALELDRGDMLLVGPVQGGLYLDLVAKAAQELSRMEFDVYAVGGPVQLMVNYSYKDLVRLVMTAKMNLPAGAPLHLFGAGNPHMIALAVAMGVDMFDSASYILYARDGRYMTPHGVYRIDEMGDLPCECPICSATSIEELRELPAQDRVYKLALHNLYVLRAELRRVKNAIKEGRLWELVELRARSHPSLTVALREYGKYIVNIEKFHRVTKGIVSGLFFYDAISRIRPEVYRHHLRLKERYRPPSSIIAVIVVETNVKPFSRFGWISELNDAISQDPALNGKTRMIVVSGAFGPIPIELDMVYPLSQYESALDLRDPSVARSAAADVVWHLLSHAPPSAAVVFYEKGGEVVADELCKRLRRRGIRAFERKFSNVDDAISFLKLVLRFYT